MYKEFEQLLQSRGISSYKVAKDTGVSQTAQQLAERKEPAHGKNAAKAGRLLWRDNRLPDGNRTTGRILLKQGNCRHRAGYLRKPGAAAVV